MSINKSYFKFSNLFLALGVIIFSSVIFFLRLNSNPYSPKIFLWAWERPENLLFLDNKNNVNIGVAFYAGIITFSDSKTFFRPRLQPLAINPKISPIAVIRIENKEYRHQLENNQLLEAVDLIVKICSQNKISGCQLDFDAANSEIDFYKKLIWETKNNLPQSMPLSITTLVSWCHSGSWLEDLPIDEAVPMFFRLGLDDYLIRSHFVGESFMKARICQKSIGISLDEPLPQSKYLENRRIYIFNPNSWTLEDFSNIIKEIEERQQN
jgi:hypothetical protein